MKKSFIIIFVFISHLSYSQDRKLSLSECIDLAIENNENLKNSKLEEKISKSLSKEYLSIGFPQINLDGGLKYNHDVPKSLIDISRFMPGVPEGTEQEVQFGQTYDGRADLFINQMIFNGSYFVGLSAAKELVRLSEKLTKRNEIDINDVNSLANEIINFKKNKIKYEEKIKKAKIYFEEYLSDEKITNSYKKFFKKIVDSQKIYK